MPGVELATGYVTIVPDTSRVAREMARAFGPAGDAAGRQGGEAAGDGMAAEVGKLGGKGGPIAAAVGGAFLVAGGLAAATFGKAFGDALEKEKTLDLTQARLGVDDATAQKIGAAAGRAYGNAFGESVADNIDTARTAIQAGLIDPSATAQDIEKVISQLSGISDFMAFDMTETAKAAGNLVKNGLVSGTEEAFDVLTAGYRAVGLQGDDLIESVREYSAGWAQTGLDAKTTMALIAQSVDLGSDSTDRAADALREFGRRMYEEADTIKETLTGLDLPAEELFEAFKGGGPEAVAAFDQVFDAIRQIEDPLERANAAQALLGDTAGDFIGVFTQWDPSEAVSKFGEVTGAANDVLATMGGNASTSIDSAKRSWELAMGEVGGAFAQAFAPHLAKLADWISDHQPEILGFLGAVADGAFAMTDAFLLFAAGGLEALAMFAESAGPLIGRVTDPLGKVAELVGRITHSDDLTNFGKSMQELDTSLGGVADRAYDMAATINDTVRPGLDGMRESVGGNITVAQHAEEVMRALGDTVTALPSEHGIVISENSPEITARLEALGLKVTTLPDGRVEVTANTSAAEQMMRDFISRNGGQQLKVDVLAVYRGVTTGGSVPVPGNARGTDALGIRDIPGLATGGRAGRTLEGVLWGPGTPTSDSILGVGADGVPTARVSTGEGVVRADMMRRGGGDLVAALNRGWVPPADFVRDIVRGGARLWHGDYDGSLNRIGVAEDNPLVAGAIGLRDLLVKGDYSSNLRDATGLEEDHPLISAVLGGRSLLNGQYDPRLRRFGIEEDSPLAAAGLGAGALLGRGDYNPNLRQFGIEEDSPLVDAGIGIGALARGDYRGNLRRFGLEEDNPLISAALGARTWLANLPNLAGGGVAGQRALSYARGHDGEPYVYGALDCSGIHSGVYNQLTGKNVRFTTASDFAAFGFKPGTDPTGYTIGTNGGLGTGGHMAGRLLGTAIESDGSNGIQFGGTADGPEGFPKQWYLPRDLWAPPETDDPSMGSAPGGLGTPGGGTGAPGGGGGGGVGGGSVGGGTSSAGGTYGGQEVPAGVTPVWVVNAGGPAADTSTASTPGVEPAAPADSFAPETKPAEMPDVNARLQGMGNDFLNSNVDTFLGDLGFRRSGGAVQALVQSIYDAMARETAAAMKRQRRQQETVAAPYGFGSR